MPLEHAALWSVIGNVAMFAAALVLGEVLVLRYRLKSNSPSPEPVSRHEISLALICVMLNSLVAVAGLFLWRARIIRLRPDADLLPLLLDVTILRSSTGHINTTRIPAR